MHVVIAKTTPSGRFEPHLLNLQQLSHTLLLNVAADFIIVSLVMSISKFLKMHQKTIRVQLREGPHFVLFILSVILSSWEVTFRSPNLNIVCSTATSLSPLIKKVTFYRTFVYREPHKVWKVKKVRKTVFWAYESQIAL